MNTSSLFQSSVTGAQQEPIHPREVLTRVEFFLGAAGVATR